MFLASNPIGWATLGAVGVIAVGSSLLYYADDLNKGWTTERWLNFSCDLGFSTIPAGGMTTKIGKVILKKPLSKKTITTVISKNSKNIPYELNNMIELGISGTVNKGYNTYVVYGKYEKIYKNAFGLTSKDRKKSFFISTIRDFLMDFAVDTSLNK